MPETAVEEHLNLMQQQRHAIFKRLANVSEAQLWQRPYPSAWSAGEHLDHSKILNRSFRRLIQGLWPLLWLPATLFHHRPYPTNIDNVYARPNMPSWVGVFWSPHYTPEQPASLATLEHELSQEHAHIARFYRQKDEKYLGNAILWDPAIGRLNLIQALRVGIHHDQHHYQAVTRLLELSASKDTPLDTALDTPLS